MPIKTKCIQCGRTYINYNDLCTVCRKVESNPFDIFNDIDAIDIGKEQDIIHSEHAEQDDRDFPRQVHMVASRVKSGLSKYALRKMQKRTDRETIKRFKKQEGSAIDVTGLG
jgi:hypothetical protein